MYRSITCLILLVFFGSRPHISSSNCFPIFKVFLKRTKGLSATLIPRPTVPALGTPSGRTCSLPTNKAENQETAAASKTLESTDNKIAPPGQTPTAGCSPPIKQKTLSKVTTASGDSAALADLESLTSELLRKTEDWSIEQLYNVYAPTFNRSLSFSEDDFPDGLSVPPIHRPTPPALGTPSGSTCSLSPNKAQVVQQSADSSETLESTENKIAPSEQTPTAGCSPPIKQKRLLKATTASGDSTALANLESLTTEMLKKTEDWSVEQLYNVYAPTFNRFLSLHEDDVEEQSPRKRWSTAGSKGAHCAKPMDNPEAETGATLVKKLRKLTEDHNVMGNLEAVINSVQQDCEAMSSEDFMSAYLPSLSRLSNETTLDSDSMQKVELTFDTASQRDAVVASPTGCPSVHSLNTSSGSEHLSPIVLSDEVSTPALGSGAAERDSLGTKKCRYQKRKSNSPKETFKQAEVTSNSTESLGDVAPVNTSADTFDAPAGVWVECVRCLKWRFLEDVKDPTELNEAWHCALQSKYADKEDLGAACEEPETTENINETQYVYGEFATGSVVLAKMTGYPEWPSMIDCDAEGRFAEFCPKTGEVKSYRVVFLDPENRTTQLIPANRVRRFNNASVIRLEKRYGKYKRKLEAAIQEATKALELPVEERVYIYGYPYEKENVMTPRKKPQ